MVSFNTLFAPVFLAVMFASSSLAIVTPIHLKHATHGAVRNFRRGIKIEPFHPASTYQTFGAGIEHPLSKGAKLDIEDSSVSFVEAQLKVDASTVKFRSSFSSDIVHHAYVSQVHDGIPFANAVANIAFNRNNKVVAFGSSFMKSTSIASSTATVSLDAAIKTAEDALDGRFNDHPATLEYFVGADGAVALTHVMQIKNEAAGTWFQAFVNAHSGELVSIVDFVTKASYLVLPVQKELPTQGFEILTDPTDTIASPSGWHSTGGTNTTGNNVISFKGRQSATTPQSSIGQNFIYPPTVGSPTTTANVNAAGVNVFYIGNAMHDISYRYGFTEAASNFQNNNFGKGGAQNDRVTISVQDSSGTNNAQFKTPPDGQSGEMSMFLWTRTNPQRDGAFENDIVVHEYTHGITNRMTGGGTGRCLQSLEARGLGEGWSDAMASWTEKTSSAVPDYMVGQWVVTNPAGIRSHPYSTSVAVNPLRYSSVASQQEEHNIGEVWANMLHNVYAALVQANGFSTTARTNPVGTAGNVVFLHLFIDALPLQPCNPTFVTARNAWIQADVNRYAGANKCILWRAFASRGLGVNAANFRDGFTIPAGC
ncbi:metalloprotease [Tricholoma matsutake]|nr:metalloprotease [Tricholoma matsutake 945]